MNSNDGPELFPINKSNVKSTGNNIDIRSIVDDADRRAEYTANVNAAAQDRIRQIMYGYDSNGRNIKKETERKSMEAERRRIVAEIIKNLKTVGKNTLIAAAILLTLITAAHAFQEPLKVGVDKFNEFVDSLFIPRTSYGDYINYQDRLNEGKLIPQDEEIHSKGGRTNGE